MDSSFIQALIILFIFSVISAINPESPLLREFQEPVVVYEPDEAMVERVVDGDTIVIEGGQRVRYIGMDTPENTSKIECFGHEAEERNRQLVENKVVRLEKDVSETDRYGRLLRYVYVDEIMINELLVKEGYALPATYPPDVRYQDLFHTAEVWARENEMGLWGGICD